MNTAGTQQSPSDAPPEVGKQDGGHIHRHALNLARNLKDDSSFRMRFTAARKGGYLIAQAITGAIYLFSLPVLIQPIIIGACCALVGVGLCGIRYGFASAWDRLEKICDKTFPSLNNPPIKIRLRAQSIAGGIAERPLMRKLLHRKEILIDGFAQNPRFKKLSEKPFMQRLLNSRAAAVAKQGLSEKQQDVFLPALAVQGAIATIVICSLAVAAHAAALSTVTTAGWFLTARMWFAASAIAVNGYTLFKDSRFLHKSLRGRKSAREPAAVNTMPPQETKAAPLPAKTAAAFNGKAVREEPAQSSTSSPPPAPAPTSPEVL